MRAVDPGISALILTSYDDHEALRAAVLAGAAGYVLKDIKGSDLVDAVRRVNAGENLIEATVVHRMRASMARDSSTPASRR